jgi:transposase
LRPRPCRRTEAERRVDRLTLQITEHLPSWSMAPVATAIQAMRGVALINAVTIVTEVGDFCRFGNPRQLMAYLGLVPSEHSSGAAVRGGGITKAAPRATRPYRRSLDLPHAGTRQPEAVRSA